jgi:hypothetical protein
LKMSEADTSLDTSTGSVGSLPAPSLTEPRHLVSYIKRVAVSLLEEDEPTPASIAAFQAALSSSTESIQKFISDPQVRSLFVQKTSSSGKASCFPDILFGLFCIRVGELIRFRACIP